LAGALLCGCAGLIPPRVAYQVLMAPVLPEGRGDYSIDYQDSSVVFSKEGALIKVKPMTDDELNSLYPDLFDGRHVNPYTNSVPDPLKGFIRPRFTVFQVTVVNMTYAKIEFDPALAELITDAGEDFRYYDAGREGANPLGGNSFTKYYKTELGISGNEKELSLERMGIVYKTIYHRSRPVFRDDKRMGMVAFDPLPENVRSIRLRLNRFVLSFDANNNPQQTIDIEYSFKVDQQVVKLEAAQRTGAG
jgi:hypothetical protein